MMQAVNQAVTQKATVLSGIQPTSSLHIGNYVGALSVWVETQATFDSLFCVANMHALTIPDAIKPNDLREKSREIAGLLIACGIDPQQSVIFLQSDVPAHVYLGWIFDCCTPISWLERMTQYKTKAAQIDTASSGLLTYPVLQAADILIYKAKYVPVGEDQKQHIELTRDIAQRFNHLYGEYFPIPEPLIRANGARIMGLDDPSVKMSKSLAQTRKGHAIGVLDSPDTIHKSIMSAVTDSSGDITFQTASAGVRNLLILYEALSRQPRTEIEFHFAGKGYSYLKKETADLVIQILRPIQEKYYELAADRTYIEDILTDGAARASAIANQTLADVRRLIGV
jgi:tryptophanyl-tRNA synthetase